MILTQFKMLLMPFLLLGCINFATLTKPKIFTITSTTTLQRNQESIWTFESESSGNETALKNILMSLLRKFNETESYESARHEIESSKSVELSDTYISFGNISAMLTKVAYVDFSKFANSNVDIIMKVEESTVQRIIQINSTISTEKMSLFGNVTLLGSNYGFTIELAKPTFHQNKIIVEETSKTTNTQSEIFTFDHLSTNFQPKDFKTFLIGRNGLTTSILQRMADSWLPPIIESLNTDSLFHKIQHYEMKLRTDDKTSFSRKICRWIKMQSNFSATTTNVPINSDGVRSMNFSMNNIGSYESCDSDFLSVKGTNNIRMSLVLGYPSETSVNVSVSGEQVLTTTTTTTTSDYPDYEYRNRLETQIPELTQYFETTCKPIEIRTVEVTIEFKIEERKIKHMLITLNKQDSLQISCPDMGIIMSVKYIFPSVLQDKLTEFLNKLLIK